MPETAIQNSRRWKKKSKSTGSNDAQNGRAVVLRRPNIPLSESALRYLRDLL
jgi:hypothetical protein